MNERWEWPRTDLPFGRRDGEEEKKRLRLPFLVLRVGGENPRGGVDEEDWPDVARKGM